MLPCGTIATHLSAWHLYIVPDREIDPDERGSTGITAARTRIHPRSILDGWVESIDETIDPEPEELRRAMDWNVRDPKDMNNFSVGLRTPTVSTLGSATRKGTAPFVSFAIA